MYKKFIIIIMLFLLNGCATSSTAFLGPIFTGAKTGSIYQASISYSTGRIINELVILNTINTNLTSTIIYLRKELNS